MLRELAKNIIWGCLAVIMLAGCRRVDPNIDLSTVRYDDTPYPLEYGTFPVPRLPDDNVLTEQGVQLGRMLFYEKRLSLDGSISCSSCHEQKNAFSDPREFSLGVDNTPGARHAMAVFNMAWNTNEFFWDGRAHLLRDQSLMPIEDPLEMKNTLEQVVETLQRDNMYQAQFIRAFGSETITAERISLALEQFMLSIVSVESRYDKAERNEIQFTASEERGRALFVGEYNPFFPTLSGADCEHCHAGKNFEKDFYRNNGLDKEEDWTDLGRFDVTGDPDDRAAFKVPSLRNIELTAPYMHDGRFATLEEVIDHYDHGLQPSSTIAVTLEYTREDGLFLTPQDKIDLVAFLKTLTDDELMTDERYSSPFE